MVAAEVGTVVAEATEEIMEAEATTAIAMIVDDTMTVIDTATGASPDGKRQADA